MAGSATFEGMLKRDRTLVLAALALIVLLAWADLFAMALDMDDGAAGAPVTHWSAGYFAAMFAMWAIMMAGMMVPSAAPAILLFASLRRHARANAGVDVALFAAGYLITWTAFSLAATFAQWGLEEGAMLTPAMTSAGPILAGVLFFVAGLYQFSPLKGSCLDKCRAPAQFIAQRHREGRLGALAMGLDHGAYCVGCCWALMALLFAFGVMNLLWIAALAAFVLAEKLLPAGPAIARFGGVAMMGLGLVLLTT